MTTSDEKRMVSFVDDAEIVREIDDIARREGSDRSALCRRGLRLIIFLSNNPSFGNIPLHLRTNAPAPADARPADTPAS